ncbi:MAG TPA: hypothetical protein VJS92_11245, partial [Candidatus Polarisedimenticolaceae bacterium]|nr:hypothetical protein [Candidatus Polarisedimenticolaceae bacterium]
SLVLGPGASYAEVLDVLRAVPAPAPVDFEPVDRYSGPPLAQDEVSLTVRVRLQPAAESLTEERVESYRQQLIEALASRLGIGLRA